MATAIATAPPTDSTAQRWSDTAAKLALARPFGAYRELSDDLATTYLELVGALRPSAEGRRLYDACTACGAVKRAALFRDAAVRRTIEDVFCQVSQHINVIEPARLDDLLREITDTVQRGECILPASGARPIRGGATPSYVFGDTASLHESPTVLWLHEEIGRRLTGMTLLPTGDVEAAALGEAVDLATAIAPQLADSALSHIFLVVLGAFADPKQYSSMTMPGLPGIVFINPLVVRGPFELAKALVHEGVHLKFMDIDYVQPLFTAGFRPRTSPLVVPPWHAGKPGYHGWPVDRLMTSMHVYASLAAYLAGAIQRADEDFPPVENLVAERQQCIERAQWLHDSLAEQLGYLSPDGRAFVAFVGSTIGRANSASSTA